MRVQGWEVGTGGGEGMCAGVSGDMGSGSGCLCRGGGPVHVC